MAEKAGLFKWIRETSFLKFLMIWIVSIFIFAVLYWITNIFSSSINIMLVDGTQLLLNLRGIAESLYASFLVATIFGQGQIVATGIFRLIFYVQVVFSIIVVLILIDKLLHKYIFPSYKIYHTQEKKINTMIMTMSIFRDDINRLKSEFKHKTKHHINLKDIESIIDGLYVTFLDIEKMFSARNMHKKDITNTQHAIVIANIEDSLHTLSKFIDFLTEHKIDWKDKSVEFWIKYILETADKITLHFEDVKISNPQLIVSIENIKEYTQEIEKKI